MHCSNRKCKAANCQDHTFSLKSLRPETYYRQQTSMVLCPKLNRYSFFLFRDGITLSNSFPVFNQDKKWYTPAFTLEIDKVLEKIIQNYSSEMDQQMLYDQQRKIKDTEESKH